MLWNVQYMGKPDAICRALKAHESAVGGTALESFSQTRPILERLLELSHSHSGVLQLSAFTSADGTTVSIVVTKTNVLQVE